MIDIFFMEDIYHLNRESPAQRHSTRRSRSVQTHGFDLGAGRGVQATGTPLCSVDFHRFEKRGLGVVAGIAVCTTGDLGDTHR